MIPFIKLPDVASAGRLLTKNYWQKERKKGERR
jgi:hypothetical protein